MNWENAFWCENDDFCREVLKFWFPKSIGYGDITKQSFREWRYRIDILTAGFPCQPFSNAGKRKGANDYRYLWPWVYKDVREIRPPWFIGENVDGIASMVQPGTETQVESQASLFEAPDTETILEQEYTLGVICRDLEREGYQVQPYIIPACSVGAPHQRYRCFIIAHSDRNDAGRRRFRKAGQKKRKGQGEQEKRERVRSILERTGEKRITTHSGSEQLQERTQEGISENREKDKSRLDYWTERFGNSGIVADAYKFNGNDGGFCTSEIPQLKTSGIFQMPGWSEFPTQSPVLGGNDGFSDSLDGITFSKWRSESVKGYGNAIVPQVAYEIFKAIETVERNLQIP
ncbi:MULTISPECIES: DNA cytosine methyltransferase [unclassified Parabacteroides]|nr:MULTISPECIES: DNA cytosine methyltransferase [unclassified Parabacteroides]